MIYLYSLKSILIKEKMPREHITAVLGVCIPPNHRLPEEANGK